MSVGIYNAASINFSMAKPKSKSQVFGKLLYNPLFE